MTQRFLGLDIGGTKSAAVVGDEAGTVLFRATGLTPQVPWSEAVAFHYDLIRSVCREAEISVSDAVALGVSCGGPLDFATGVIYTPPNLPHWAAVPLKALLEAEFRIPIAIENDANATALAEHRWGAGVGFDDMAFLTMGTGIGAGLILDGTLYRGRNGLAGEVGHATILPGGPLCSCGKHGCLETLASGPAIARMGRERFGEAEMTAKIVCDRARDGDPIAREIVAEAAHWMGVGIANLLHTLNLECIVLGTLAVHAADLLLEPIRVAMRRHCWPHIWEGVTIVSAALGDGAQDRAALAVALSVLR